MIFSTVVICFLAFFIGFLLGKSNPKYPKPVKSRRQKRELEPKEREFINFLNYDGSEQA